MKKLFALLLASVMLLGLLAGCTGGENDSTAPVADATGSVDATGSADATGGASADMEPQYGGHLNVAFAKSLSGIDPVTYAEIWWYMYQTCIYEGPLTRDAQNEIAPGVCEYEMAEDSLSIKLWVREGVTFHDGTAVEIEDVKASIERACNRGNSVPEYFGAAVESMEIEGDVLTIKFKALSMVERAMSRLAAYQTWMAVMPKEICQEYFDKKITEMEYAIGTGPYRLTDYELRVLLTVERYEDYVPVEPGRTGFAAPKMAYLDSITFYENLDYSSITMATLSGQYDITDVIESEYQTMANEAGLYREYYGQALGNYLIYFNNTGNENLCSKYPELRKAIMAAIDIPTMMDVYSDYSCEVNGGAPLIDEKYQTTYYADADWWGAANQEVVDKYLNEARAKGYKDESIQLVLSAETMQMTLLTGYLDDAGINYHLNFMDEGAAKEFLLDPANNWDMQFDINYGAYTPSTLDEENTTFFYVSEDRDRLLNELLELVPGTDEYIAKWQELHKLMVDDCSIIHLGFVHWYWFQPENLHLNFDSVQAYFFNSWWEDPENHPRT